MREVSDITQARKELRLDMPRRRAELDDDDVVLLECGWDRSRRDPSLEPAYILWADGTNDEMCFATITVRR